MLYIVYKSYRSARRYQRELMKDKEALVESERPTSYSQRDSGTRQPDEKHVYRQYQPWDPYAT